MQALKALFKINQHFGCRLTMGAFMRASTISAIAGIIDCHNEKNISSSNASLSFDDKMLTFHQRRLCFFQQRFPQSVAYNMTYRLPWCGVLDKQRLQSALTALIGNHTELRTSFHFNNEGHFERNITPQYQVLLQYTDVSTADDGNARVNSLITEQAKILLAVDSGEPHCFSLIKLKSNKYILVMTVHHIVADEWSVEQLFSEWIERYAQGTSSETIVGEKFVINQTINDDLDVDNTIPETCKDYWLEQLKDAPPSTILPADFKQTTNKYKKAEMALFSLPAELTQQCSALAEKLDVSLFSFMLSAFYLLLHKYTAQTDLVIGTPITGRVKEESLGFYVNMLCYRKQITIKQSVADFVFEVQELHNQNLSYSEMPFDYLVDQLCSARSDYISPLFQHSFSFAESFKSMPEIEQCTIGRPEYVSNQECKFDFSLQLSLNGEKIDGRIEYDCSTYGKDNINGFVETLEIIVRQMVLTPNRPVNELATLSNDQHQVILDWNDTKSDFSHNVNIVELIESKLHRFQDNIALRSEQRQLTYKQLSTGTNRLCHYLISQGCTKGSRIAVSVAPSFDLIISMLAIMKAGAIYVPIDPSYPIGRRNYMLQDSKAELLLTDQHSEHMFESCGLGSINVEKLDLSAYSDAAPDNHCGPDDVAYIIYTSGSTGNPKGVEVFHKGVCNLAEAEVELLKVGINSQILQFAAFSFDTSIWEMIVTLVAGATLVVASRQAMMPGKNLATLCQYFDITHLTLPASALASMPVDSLSSVQVLIVAGEACSEQLMKKWSVGRVFINSYGPTEATVSVCNAQLCAEDHKVHIGKPLANTQCWVLDENQKLLPIGAVGELYVSGVGLAKGYLNKPEQTNMRFGTPLDVLIPVNRLYRTGDVVRYLSHGNLEYLGRADEQVKIRGFRVELTEIENSLCQHEQISNAVVLATELDDNTEVALVAYIVTDKHGAAFNNEVRRHLNDILPVYAVPQFIVPLQSLPKLPNNKIDRSKLPKVTQLSAIDKYPTTIQSQLFGVEKVLADIWLKLLSLSEIGPETSFFEVGGHSLLAVKVASMMRKKGWELDVNTFFKSAKLSYLANQCIKINPNKTDSDPQTTLPEVNESVPLTHFQQGLWFESCKGAANTYNVCKVFLFKDSFEQAFLVQALNLVFRANDVFSIQFEDVEGVAQQYRSVTNHRTNLAYLREAQTESKIIDFATKLAAEPIRLGQHSPIESALFKDLKNQLYLVINVHHILMDDASMQELLHLIVTAHDTFKSGAQPEMSECKSFLGYAQQFGQPTVKRITSQRDFWTQKLNRVSTQLALPYSKTTENQEDDEIPRGKVISLQLPAVISQQVQQISAKYTTTAMIAWLSIFMDFLQKYTKQNDLCVGVPVSNRPLNYTDGAIGLYLNTLVFRYDSSAEEALNIKLENIKHCWLESYEYRDTPLSKIIEWISGEEKASFSLFDIMFVYKYSDSNDRVNQTTVNNDTAKFPLTFFVENSKEGVILSAEFNTCLFEESDILDMISTFAEHANLHFDFNKVTTNIPFEFDVLNKQKTLTAIEQFEFQAKKTPDHIALQAGELHLTYFELNKLANQCADNLAHLNPERLQRLGILLPRSEAMIAVLLGCLKLGIAYVPLDIDIPEHRLCYIAEDAGLDIVVVADITLEGTQKILAETNSLTQVVSINSLIRGVMPKNNIRYHNTNPDLSTLAYIIYTSGSTGHPKGVMVDNAGLGHYLSYASDAYVFRHNGSTAFHLSFAFDASITSIFVPLLNGGSVHVISQGDEVEQLLALLADDHLLDFIKLTPAHVDLLAQGLDKSVNSFDGALVIGGEALLRNTLVDIKEKLPNSKLINEYGPTETIVGCCVYDASNVCTQLSEAVPIGQPVKGIELAILDQHGCVVEKGQIGELYICGEHLALGYLNKSELTASKFTPCHMLGLPFSGYSYASGDLVVELADGNLLFKGRLDDQIKHKGYRIELSEIEAVIRKHSSIAECVVIYKKQDGNQGGLHSFVTINQQIEGLAEQDIRDFCSGYLPAYMLPESVTLIDQLPLTSNGKIDRKALQELHKKPIETASSFPMTKTESMVHGIWQQLLNLDDFGIHDSFFALGGDSIFCLQVVFKLRKQGFSIKVATLLTHNTIAQLASSLDQKCLPQHVDISNNSLNPYEGELPLTPIQHWLFSHNGSGHECFNQAYLYCLKRQVDIKTLEIAIINTLNRHVAMRQSFSKNSQGKYQASILSSITIFELKVVQTEAESEESELDWINGYASNLDMAFDLTQAPLFKALIFETQYSEDFRILFVAHHTVVDAISWAVLVDEISQSYAHPNAKPLHNRFENTLADYTQWRKKNDMSASEIAIWERRKVLPFPSLFDQSSGNCQANIYRDCRYFSQRLNKEKTEILEQVAGYTMGVSVQEVLLAALAKAIANWTQANQVKIDVESHGRLDGSPYDLATTVGWLTAIYPTHFSNVTYSKPKELLEQAAQQLREVPQKGVGYGELQTFSSGGWMPDAEICFNYLGKAFTRTSTNDAIIQKMDPKFNVQSHSPELSRWHLIEFDAWIEQGCCQISWTFSKALHKRDAIARLAELFEQSLDELLETAKSSVQCILVPADLPASVVMSLSEMANVQRYYPNVQTILPATPAQQGMAFHTLYNSGGPVYHEQILYTVSVPLDLERFHDAWHILISKHGMLRAALDTDRFQAPVIVVRQSVHAIVGYTDLSTLTQPQQDGRIKLLMDVDLACPFVLDKSPLIRAHLIVTGKTSNQLFISHHHAILDGWSLTQIIDELNTLLNDNVDYQPQIQNSESALSGVKHFAEYVSQHSHPDAMFWEKILDQNINSESFPFVTSINEKEGANAAIHQRVHIGSRDMAIINECATDLNVTLSTLVQGAWALVLYYFSRGEDSVFGVTLSGRTIDVTQVESLVGLCINTLPMRVRIEPERHCKQWLLDIQKMMYSIQEHSQTSLPELTKMFQTESRNALFDSIVVLTNYQNDIDINKEVVIEYKHSRETTNFPLTLVISESKEGLDCRLSGLPERIKPLWLSPILRAFSNSLLSLAQNRRSTISSVIQMSNDQMCDDLSCITGDFAPLKGATPSEKLAEFAKSHAHHVAVTDAKGELSYSQLDICVNNLSKKVADQLDKYNQENQFQPVIGVCCKRNRALLVGLISCLRLNATFLPLDPELPLQRLHYMAKNAGVSLILSDHIELFSGSELERCLFYVEPNLECTFPDVAEDVVQPLQVSKGDLAYIIYTSGSTGKPKGVKVGVESFLNYLEFASSTYANGQPISSCVHSSIGFDGTISSLFIPIMSGGTVKMIAEENTLGELAAEIRRGSQRLLIKITPSHLSPLAEQLNGRPIEHLKAVIIGGEALDYRHLSTFKHCAPDALFINEYGPTEATVGCSVNIFDPFELEQGAVSIGYPIHNTELLVCSDDMKILPCGAVGELCISGIGVAEGYINLSSFTDKKFVLCTGSDSPNRRVYRTGDMVYCQPDGKLSYIGRQDDQIKLNGVRIELGEIEEVIRQHAQVDGVAVVVSASQPNKLLAFIVGDEDQSPDNLRQKLQLTLPTYMMPRHIIYIESLPFTINGKIDRSLLMQKDVKESNSSDDFVEPETELQHHICSIFCELLKKERIGLQGDFFALGGHSLTAMQLLSRISQHFGVSISLKTLFSSSAVDSLAALIEQQNQNGSKHSVEVKSKAVNTITSIPSIRRASRRIS
jgi:amino acid adenylation domain-containing protein/non-ribosomal peptide synthase protein (TIGR01720 family)